jgi:hypothetical protein
MISLAYDVLATHSRTIRIVRVKEKLVNMPNLRPFSFSALLAISMSADRVVGTTARIAHNAAAVTRNLSRLGFVLFACG